VTELARRADVHRSTVHRALAPLQHRGIIYQTDDGAYALNDGFEQLSTFARELAHQVHRQTVEEQTDTYTILWESLDEFLVQTPTEPTEEHFIPTGPDQFQRYGLPLLARDRRHYLYSETAGDLSPEMLCCHMLVIDSGARAQSYCLLLLSHVDIDRDELEPKPPSTASKTSSTNSARISTPAVTSGRRNSPSGRTSRNWLRSTR